MYDLGKLVQLKVAVNINTLYASKIPDNTWDCWGPRQWLTDNHRVAHPGSVVLLPYIEESHAVHSSWHPVGLRIPDHDNRLLTKIH